MSDEEITRTTVEEGQLPSGVLKLRLSSMYGKFSASPLITTTPQVAEAVIDVMDDLLGDLFVEARREDLVEEDIERAHVDDAVERALGRG